VFGIETVYSDNFVNWQCAGTHKVTGINLCLIYICRFSGLKLESICVCSINLIIELLIVIRVIRD
jgi:hypothetical protein